MLRLPAASRCKRSDRIAILELSYNLGDTLLEFQIFAGSFKAILNIL